MKLEDLQANATVRGILTDGQVTVVSARWFGSDAMELTYRGAVGELGSEILYRDDEARLEVVEQGRPWSFDGDGELFRLVSEALRIHLAHLFDPTLAVHTSLVEPLPHQITAVYEAMLPRQPLRFLLADDPGAGKTIMTALLMKELIARGDLQRCLVVCPGSLAEQWQDELYQRFHLNFEIFTNDKAAAARTGNWFLETDLAIARLDKLARDDALQEKLQAPDCRWDLIVCDEAHKMSASFTGGEIRYTKRYRLGQLLGALTRHLLLLTATPHNGKEEDFQLFMALLDGDRFEGRFRDGVHAADVSDLMRRMVKERLLTFDATPLFPERVAHTIPYQLSDVEAHLYEAVTSYVRGEFNRAEALENNGRAGTVGFALTLLQRRLASSPEAIYQSLRRRRERLQSRLSELELLRRGGKAATRQALVRVDVDADDLEDLEDLPADEQEERTEEILDQATAARSVAELKAEITTLRHVEEIARSVRRGGRDAKWRQLAGLLGEILPSDATAFPADGNKPLQKLVIFTEHRDTLAYLRTRIATMLGREQAVVVIHGGMGREERAKAQEAFRHDPGVLILLATDAAGEGINLQRADLDQETDATDDPAATALRTMHDELRRVVASLQESVRAAMTTAEERIRELGNDANDVWRKAVEASAKAYGEASAQLETAGISSPAEYRDLLDEQNDLQREIARLEHKRTTAQEREEAAASVLQQYREVRAGLSARRERFANETSSDLVRIRIGAAGDRRNLPRFLHDNLGIAHFDQDHAALTQRIDPQSSGAWTWRSLDRTVGQLHAFIAGKASWDARDGRFERA